MIPYFSPGPWQIGPFTIHAFGILVGLAIILGVTLTGRDADKRGLSQTIISEAQIWALVVGFLMAHWVSVIFYFPERIKEDPLELLWVWKGISSFGGFLGGVGGLVFYFKLKKVDVWPHIDCFGWGFAWAWILGRLGCTTAHDHMGKVAETWFSVQYPAYQGAIPGAANPTADVGQFIDPVVNKTLPYVQRYDLGFYELIFTLVLVTFLFITNRKATKFPGYNVAILAMFYAPVRFFFDYLRVQDKTYLGLTPGQYFAIGLFALGVWMYISRSRAARAATGAEAVLNGSPSDKKAPPEKEAAQKSAARDTGRKKTGKRDSSAKRTKKSGSRKRS